MRTHQRQPTHFPKLRHLRRYPPPNAQNKPKLAQSRQNRQSTSPALTRIPMAPYMSSRTPMRDPALRNYLKTAYVILNEAKNLSHFIPLPAPCPRFRQNKPNVNLGNPRHPAPAVARASCPCVPRGVPPAPKNPPPKATQPTHHALRTTNHGFTPVATDLVHPGQRRDRRGTILEGPPCGTAKRQIAVFSSRSGPGRWTTVDTGYSMFDGTRPVAASGFGGHRGHRETRKGKVAWDKSPWVWTMDRKGKDGGRSLIIFFGG